MQTSTCYFRRLHTAMPHSSDSSTRLCTSSQLVCFVANWWSCNSVACYILILSMRYNTWICDLILDLKLLPDILFSYVRDTNIYQLCQKVHWYHISYDIRIFISNKKLYVEFMWIKRHLQRFFSSLKLTTFNSEWLVCLGTREDNNKVRS